MRSLFTVVFPRIALLAVAGCCCSVALSQQGILDQPAAIDKQAKDVKDAKPDPFARQQLSIAGRGNRQMADAISALARTGRWTQVNLLLERLAKQKLSTAALATMQGQMEPAIFVEMQLSDQLSANAKSALDRLVTGANQFRQSPERLRAAIQELDDQSTDKQLAAARILIEGGNAAIRELVAAAVATKPSARRDTILRALLRLGPGGTSALRQLALHGTPAARQGAVQSLARISSPTTIVDLLAVLHSADSSTEEINVAARYLRRATGQVPSRSAAVGKLISDLDQKQRVAFQVDNSDETVTLWSVNAKRDGVLFSKTKAIYSIYRETADAAARLRYIGALAPEIITKSLVADLGYRVLVDPDWGDPSQIDSLRSSYAKSLDGVALSGALENSIETNNHAATIGLIRLVESVGVASPGWGDLLLRGNGPNASPLVAATSSPVSRIRYEAALAASRLADGDPYAGSSQVKQALSEMLRLTDLPIAIIVETRPEVIASIQQLVSRLGYRVVTAQDVAQFMRCVDRGGDIRLVVSKTQLYDLQPIEMIDLVRRTGRGSQLPIVFYGSVPDHQNVDSTRWDGPTVWIDMPTTPSAFSGILERVARRRRLPPLSAIDQQRFRREASEFIGRQPTDL